MVKKIICGIIFLQSIIYGNPIELDFSQFDNYKRTSDMIYNQAKNDSRSFSYNRAADLSKLPKDYLLQMSQPALESLEMQRKILKHLLENHIEEIKGVYVPFWLFDADADGEVRYNATKVRMWSDSEYDYTETKYYRLYRKGHVRFENIPVDGSSKMPDDMMESIEPYDLKDAVDFQTAYLAGFLADKYDVDADSSIDRANTRVKKSTEDAFMTNCGKYDTVTCEDSAVQIQNGTAKYALYPVWILNTKWRGENYSFAMNGQTGKFVGNLPENKSLVYLYYVVVTLLGSVLAYIVILILSWGK